MIDANDGYESEVNGLAPPELEKRLRHAIEMVQAIMPAHTGVTVMVFDFGAGGGLAYISNADRRNMVQALEEMAERLRRAGRGE